MANIWFIAIIGCAASAAVTMLGAWWLALKTGGVQQARAKRVARTAWWAVAGLTSAIVAIGILTRPELAAIYVNDPRHAMAATVAVAGLIGVKLWDRKETELLTFFAAASYVVGMLMNA